MTRRKKKSDIVDHHIIAECQGGPTDSWNLHPWEREKEEYWHKLFGTLLPSDCIVLIRKWERANGSLDESSMTLRDLESFQKIFGCKSPRKAIEFIEKNFLPAEQKFLKEVRKNG